MLGDAWGQQGIGATMRKEIAASRQGKLQIFQTKTACLPHALSAEEEPLQHRQFEKEDLLIRT